MNLKKIIKAIVIILSMICSISAFSQEIRIDTMNNVSVKDAMAKVKKQTGYSFDFQSKDVDTKRIVSVSAQNLNDVINQILEGQKNLIYEIRDKVIVIKKREIGNKVDYVKGSVVDLQGQSVIGATIKVFGTSNFDVTDLDGNFTIEANENAILEVSCIGFKTTETTAVFGKEIKVIMEEDTQSLNEVVVVGYGTQLRKNLSSSISKVNKDVLNNPSAPSFESMLAGRAAGVQVITGSAMGGATVSIRIRGTSSLAASSEPLYVVDGIPMESGSAGGSLGGPVATNVLASINPNDIESMEILKDAAAAAIYGSRGANGVVLISTKRGMAGKANVSVSANWSVSTATNKPRLLNGKQYIEMAQEAWTNSGNDLSTFWERSGVLQDGLTKEQALNTDTNWIDETLRIGSDQDYNVSISGSSDKLLYFVSGNFKDQNTILKGNHYQKLSTRANIESQISKIFRIGVNMMYTHVNDHQSAVSWDGGVGKVTFMLPIWPVYKEDGSYFKASGDHPTASIKERKNHYQTNHFIGNWFLKANICKDLTFRTDASVNTISNNNYKYFGKVLSWKGLAKAGTAQATKYSWNWKNVLNYSRVISKKHNIDIVIAHEMQNSKNSGNVVWGEGFFNSAMQMPIDGTDKSMSDYSNEYSFLSFIGRVNYSFKDTYLLSVSFRADASSRFAPENRWGYFPAVSIGYNMSNEKFWDNARNVINMFKIRASYGIVGNAEIGEYMFYNSYSTNSWNGHTGLNFRNIGDPKLGWEQTAQLDLGFDMEFLDGRVALNFDWYRKDTHDLLLPFPVSNMIGVGAIVRNAGELRNTGIEFNINSTNIKTRNFKWDMALNLAHNHNEVTKIPENNLQVASLKTIEAHIGYPIGAKARPQWQGVDPQTGEDMFLEIETGKNLLASEAIAKYGSIENFFNKNTKPCGNPYPWLNGGFSNTLTYKNLSLSFLFTFAVGQDFDLGIQRRSLQAFGDSKINPYAYMMEQRWQKPGDKATVSKLTTDNIIWRQTTETLHRTDYLRLKDVTLNYRIPIKSKTIKNLNCYLKGTNLATITAAPNSYWDPEWAATGDVMDQGNMDATAPQALSVILGVKIDF